MAALAFYTIIGAATLVVDLSYGIVDPRIRMGAKIMENLNNKEAMEMEFAPDAFNYPA